MSRTVEEIRKVLRDKHGYTPEQLKVGKAILREELENLESEEAVIDMLEEVDLINAEEVEEASVDLSEALDGPIIPTMDSDKWADYVMSQLRNDEMDQGNPTCDGLRRVTEYLIGPIVGRDIRIAQSPNKDNYGTATVVCSVKVLNNIPDHILYGREMQEEDAADVNKYNTQKPFCLHPTATATTRAEARALRKILRLKKVVAAEELAGEGTEDFADAWRPSDPVQDEQINLLDIVCQRCDVSVMEYINSGERIYSSIYELDKNKAQSMIQHINKIQQDKVPRPHGVGKYDTNWRNSNEKSG
tara:strand:+ start:2058 stop:2963 length:906 start_codon:yes stop_codon:yes gene_type:complete